MGCALSLSGLKCTGVGLLSTCIGDGYSLRVLQSPWSGNTYLITHAPGGLSTIRVNAKLDAECAVRPITAYCYGLSEVGPFMVKEANVNVKVYSNQIEVVTSGEGDYCDSVIALTKDSNDLGDVLGRLPKPLPLIQGGFFEDGLIWAMVRAGYVKEGELPSFIKPNQAYYWARGDVVNPSLAGWVEEGNPAYLDVLTMAYEELLSLMNEHGGVKIPYITAAKARDVYGSPQQSYIFNTLLRGFELTGDSRYLDGALKALECYLTQPPNCLGYIDLGGGMRWFRWGSRHFLSTDPQGWENLMVLNTHLMAVLSFAEAHIRGLCGSCLSHALSGVKAIIKLADKFQRGDGYLYYSLYSREHMGEGEDDRYPPYRGYSLLSSRLALKASMYLGDDKLYDMAKRACLMGYRMVEGGRWGEYEAVARCLSLIYLREDDADALNMIINVLKAAYGNRVWVKATGYDVEGAFKAHYQPATLTKGRVQLIYVGPMGGALNMVAYSEGSRIVIKGYRSPSGHGVLVKGIEAVGVNGSVRVNGSEIEVNGGALIRIDEDVVKPAVAGLR
ncbi:MAG: D-glucuronyl C5-epimerase family protein [Caldivirga sp.]